MRYTNKFLILAFLTVLFVGCSDDYLNINSDPNNAVESNITADLVLPQAILNSANRVGTGFGFLGNWLGYWAPGANYAPNTEEQSYNITTNFGAGLFNGVMDNSYDFQFAELRGKAAGDDYSVAIAKLMKAHNF